MRTRLVWTLLSLPIALLLAGCLSVQNEALYAQGGSTYHVGEVLNKSDSVYRITQVVGTYYDAAGNVVASKSGNTCADVVNPHDVAPFELRIAGSPQVARHEVAVQGEVVPSVLPTHLTLASAAARKDDIGMHVSGSVTNEGSVPYQYVKVCIAFYDGSGAVVRTAFTLVGLGDLAVGQTGSFDVWSIGLPSEATSVRLWVDARQPDSSDPIVPISSGSIALPR